MEINLSHKDFIKQKGVYKITNLVNNKVYIGSSCSSLYKRTKAHLYDLSKGRHSNFHLQKSWNFYGEKNFKIEILELTKDKLETLKREEFYIEKFKSFNPKFGYNVFRFATTTQGNKWSEEAKLRRKGFGKGKILSEETKKKMAIASTGKKASEETKIKLRSLPQNNRGVIMMDLSGNFIKEFRNLLEAAIELNTIGAYIGLVVKNKKKTCKGYRFMWKSDYMNSTNIKRIVAGCTIEIDQYTLNDKYIQSFLSIKEAEEYIQVKGSNSNISACCKGKRNNAYGYKWKYKN